MKSEAIRTGLLASELESEFLLRAVNLDKVSAFVTEDWGFLGRGVAIRPFLSNTFVRLQRYHIIFYQGLLRYAIPLPVVKFCK